MLGATTIEDPAWEQQPARWNIEVSGTVEGVGFRSFVYGLATRLGLRGFVTSQPGALAIVIEGARASLGEFLEELWLGAPRRARIEQVSCHSGPPQGAPEFRIVSRG